LNLYCLGAALAAALSAPVYAADAADPAVPVPTLAYRSALPAPADLAEPAVPWAQANQEVARFPRGHADLVRWEERQERGSSTPSSAPAAPAAPEDAHGHAH
jgi:opacity protein-like surface antigen